MSQSLQQLKLFAVYIKDILSEGWRPLCSHMNFLTFSKRVVCCFTLHLLFFLCSYWEVCKFLMICIHFNLDNTLRLNLKVHGYMNKYNYCYLKMSAWYIGIKIIICSYTRDNLYLKSIKKVFFLQLKHL